MQHSQNGLNFSSFFSFQPMGVYSMKCIDYDKKFGQDIYDKLPEWKIQDAERKEERKRLKALEASAKENGVELQDVKVKASRKRKRRGEDESDEDLEVHSELELEFEELAGEDYIVRSKGTRTRPIAL